MGICHVRFVFPVKGNYRFVDAIIVLKENMPTADSLFLRHLYGAKNNRIGQLKQT
ncbi:Hypothetical protein I595_2048 [Croceitalea dokdonensis DOKDO 023]|uniref:Uncharacterized protein n=1 Tax=Croceitalea dokdonensis DOKDO 023 TaxID=1300341 RepID=A0A0P7AEC2_9FLAO|nr:Hypothetical protein I595_2048 [Croceitalea dokdonensis DOKDO 023]